MGMDLFSKLNSVYNQASVLKKFPMIAVSFSNSHCYIYEHVRKIEIYLIYYKSIC